MYILLTDNVKYVLCTYLSFYSSEWFFTVPVLFWVGIFLFDSQPQAQQVQDEEITEDDLRLIQERESSIRQLEVSRSPFTAEYALNVFKAKNILKWHEH